MNKETKQAVEDAIELKWKPIVNEGAVDLGTKNCPLCQIFHKEECTRTVKGKKEKCPVYVKSGKPFCDGTPYEEWRKTITKAPFVIVSPETRKMAEAELKYLEELL